MHLRGTNTRITPDMNLKNIISALLLMMLTVQLVFGQSREEGTFSGKPDPIKSIQVYPNPATDVVNIKFEVPIARKVNLSVHNLLGNSIELETELVDEYEVRIRVKDLTSGYYFVSIRDDHANLRGTYKFLKR